MNDIHSVPSAITAPKASATLHSQSPSVVIIGGGVVGCSILFHLAKFGWKDVVLLERDEHLRLKLARGGNTISSDSNISRLQAYTIKLYEDRSAFRADVGLHATGGFTLPLRRASGLPEAGTLESA